MPATVHVWWIGWSSWGIGHSSFEIDRQYITWLENSGGWSSSSNSSRSSRSSSNVNVEADVIGGSWNFMNDQKTFAIDRNSPYESHKIQIRGEDPHNGPFGLRCGTRLTNWWTAARGVATPVYRAVSTEHNCNVYTMTGMRLAGASLYSEAPEFSLFAGSNKVIAYANALDARIRALNTLWHDQAVPLRGAVAGGAIYTVALWNTAAIRHQFPGGAMVSHLTQYAAAQHPRVQLAALEAMMRLVLHRLQTGAAPVPVAPVAAAMPAPVHAGNLVQVVPLAAVAAVVHPPVPMAWVVNPLDDVRVFGRRIRDAMSALEVQFAGLAAAVVLQNR